MALHARADVSLDMMSNYNWSFRVIEHLLHQSHFQEFCFSGITGFVGQESLSKLYFKLF